MAKASTAAKAEAPVTYSSTTAKREIKSNRGLFLLRTVVEIAEQAATEYRKPQPNGSTGTVIKPVYMPHGFNQLFGFFLNLGIKEQAAQEQNKGDYLRNVGGRVFDSAFGAIGGVGELVWTKEASLVVDARQASGDYVPLIKIGQRLDSGLSTLEIIAQNDLVANPAPLARRLMDYARNPYAGRQRRSS